MKPGQLSNPGLDGPRMLASNRDICATEVQVSRCVLFYGCACWAPLAKAGKKPPKGTTVKEMQRAIDKIPKTIRAKFPNWEYWFDMGGGIETKLTWSSDESGGSGTAKPYSLQGPSVVVDGQDISVEVDLEWLGVAGAQAYQNLVRWITPRQFRAGRHPARIAAAKRSLDTGVTQDQAQMRSAAVALSSRAKRRKGRSRANIDSSDTSISFDSNSIGDIPY
ncbi:hypothetical protein ABW21_db0209332 [Orbilia brochopaga]|nr:hypothetical protein ABW21_db0209332 [Drechslerella brochopaga]